jgi:HlyD family secretion protein
MSTMKKRTKVVASVIAAVAVLGAGGIAVAKRGQKGPAVTIEAVGRRDLQSVVTASGYIQPERKADISADVSGRVVELAVKEGQMVAEGDLLLRIDPSAFQAAVRRAEAMVAQSRAQALQARANLLQAESAAHRAEQLAQGDRLISSQELEEARTQYKVAQAQAEAAGYGVSQAEASLTEAREQLRKTTIVAPMAGRVTRLNIREGETAIVGTMNNPGSLLLTIADLGTMEASVRVDETDVPSISFGDSATVRIDAFPDQTFSGRVTRIANSSIQGVSTTGSQSATSQDQAVDFEVIITLDHPPSTLRPDLSATAEIVTASRHQAVAAPIIAVTVRDPDGKKFTNQAADPDDAPTAASDSVRQKQAEVEGVFTIADGKAKFVPVKVGIAGDRYFEITSGLEPGDTVIAGPYSAIRDLEEGQPVRLPEPTPEPAKTTNAEEKS